MDLREVASFCDYFVIASGTSLRHTNAIAQAIEENLNPPPTKDDGDFKTSGIKTLSKVMPGDESGWIVLDYSSVVAHIFYKPMREFYSLERLWSDAKKVRVPRES